MTTVIPADDAVAIERAADGLVRGDVVGVPTDTVYGLAVDPFRPDAVTRVFALKARPADVALPVLVGGWDQVELLAGPLPVSARNLADRHWPGALTLVVPRHRSFTADLGGRESPPFTVGLRWPAHPVIQALCSAVGPLAVTSANRHGQAPLTNAWQVASVFPRRGNGIGSQTRWPIGVPPAELAELGVGIVLDGGTCAGTPSTVVECRGPAARCLRDGALPWSTLYEAATRRDPGSISADGTPPVTLG
ncbi:MAG TPA: L-threonylcarbamoyladenylate synthase [Acidimicrobiales bacterium]|jgi:L-threonylcarbamoyladenylate synthase|nr:L-threonylcarbamoyladenylate synthase [Acidimicrobiales bacterium]